MDIKKVRKYANEKISAGKSVNTVRKKIKDERYEKED